MTMENHNRKWYLVAGNVLFFMLVFTFLGLMIPYVYYHYLDRTEYVVVTSPVVIEPEKEVYTTCENVRIRFDRISYVNAPITRVTNYIRIEPDGKQVKEFVIERNKDSLEKAEQTVNTPFQIECSLQGGKYIIENAISYSVNGVPKITYIRSKPVLIKKGGEIK